MPRITNSLNIPKYSTAPSSANNGDMYYNTTSNIIFTRINGTWIDTSSTKTKRVVETLPVGVSGTWNRPSGVTYINIFIAGAGGGGAAGTLVCVGGTAGNAAGGGGGGASRFAYVRDMYIGGSSSISYYVAAGGAGGTALTYNKAAGVAHVDKNLTNNGQSALETYFGTYISYTGGSGGGAGVGQTTGQAATGGSLGAAGSTNNGSVTTANSMTGSYYEADVPNAAIRGAETTSTTAAAIATQATGISTYDSAELYGQIKFYNTLPDDATLSISGGAFNSSATSTITKTSTAGYQCPGSGGCAANADSSSTASSAVATLNGGTYGGAAVAAYRSTAGTINITLTASSGMSASAIASGGGGGGSCVFAHSGTSTDRTASTYALTSGAGGKGSDGVIILEYFI